MTTRVDDSIHELLRLLGARYGLSLAEHELPMLGQFYHDNLAALNRLGASLALDDEPMYGGNSLLKGSEDDA